MPIVFREIYGLQVFDCARLSATLTAESCGDNFRQHRCLACHGCPIGAELTGGTSGPASMQHRAGERLRFDECRWRQCVRCERQASRLVGGAFCISCYNRQRELAAGMNRKGRFPVKVAASLHRCFALISADRNAIRAGLPIHTQTIQIERYGPGSVWLSGLLTGRDELERLVARRFPGGAVVDFEEVAPTPICCK